MGGGRNPLSDRYVQLLADAMEEHLSESKIPIAHLSPRGVILDHKYTDVFGHAENTLNGYHFSGFIGWDTWIDWEDQLKQRDRIVAHNLISYTANGCWRSTNSVEWRGSTLLMQALELEQVKGAGFMLDEGDRAIASWLDSPR